MREPDIGAAVDRLLGANTPTGGTMTEYVQLTTTTGKRQDAEQIASELVSRRLAGLRSGDRADRQHVSLAGQS